LSSEDVVTWFFGMVRGIIREELQAQGQGDEWVLQKGSPLGNRKHCAAVRRRLANSEGGAAIRGKRFLLTTRALAEELDRGGPPPAPTLAKTSPKPPADPAYDAILSVARRSHH
jgi:hypothetical protein